jgi:hypothetical protein
MAKTNSGVKEARTHFEQVPLEVVKEIAVIDDGAEKAAGTEGGTLEPPSPTKGKSARVAARSPARKRK